MFNYTEPERNAIQQKLNNEIYYSHPDATTGELLGALMESNHFDMEEKIMCSYIIGRKSKFTSF